MFQFHIIWALLVSCRFYVKIYWQSFQQIFRTSKTMPRMPIKGCHVESSCDLWKKHCDKIFNKLSGKVEHSAESGSLSGGGTCNVWYCVRKYALKCACNEFLKCASFGNAPVLIGAWLCYQVNMDFVTKPTVNPSALNVHFSPKKPKHFV